MLHRRRDYMAFGRVRVEGCVYRRVIAFSRAEVNSSSRGFAPMSVATWSRAFSTTDFILEPKR